MAITAGDYVMCRTLAREGLAPSSPRVVEFGEANWYGYHSPDLLHNELDAIAGDLAPDLHQILEVAINRKDLYVVAKVFYMACFHFRDIRSIDLHGTAMSVRFDLNHPDLPEGFPDSADIVINSGTLEHVYHQWQAWKHAHDCCRVGGLMLHALPMTGWFDHAFYTYHPTLVVDLAEANGYEIVLWYYEEWAPRMGFVEKVDFEALHDRRRRGELGTESMMHVALRKTTDAPFAIPTQGMYGHKAEALRQDWRSMRGGEGDNPPVVVALPG